MFAHIIRNYPHRNNVDTKNLLGLFLSLGWLQGPIPLASAHAVVTLVMLILISFLRLWRWKGDTNKTQRKNMELYDQGNDIKPKYDTNEGIKANMDISQLANQKFVIRRRNHLGQLKHLTTLDHPPTDEELRTFGVGDFNILTTKPFLKKWRRTYIEPTKRINRKKKPTMLENRNLYRKPEKGKKKHKREYKNRPQKRALTNQTLTQQYSGVVQEKIDVENESEDLNNIPPPPPEDTMGIEIPTQPSIPQKVRPPILVEQVQTQPPPKDLVLKIIPYEQQIVEIEKPEPPGITQQPKPSPQLATLSPKEVGQCYRCGRTLDSFIRCDFCGEIFCGEKMRDCYSKHECAGSDVCCTCNKRFHLDVGIIEPNCNNPFCSIRCQYQCLEENSDNLECEPCIKEYSRDKCHGQCYSCNDNECQDRCDWDGKCKKCGQYYDCQIHCISADDDCEIWFCKGFRCKDRTLERDGEEAGPEDTGDDESEEDMDGEDSEDEGWEESDEE